MLNDLAAPELLHALIAILVLLVLWQYYKLQVLSGRVLAVDIFDRSATRMYVYAVAKGACLHCATAHGRVYLPSVVAKPGFSPLEVPCPHPAPCSAVLVGLYGAWEEARQVLENLRVNHKKGGLTLTSPELHALLDGAWERSISADTDRLSMYMLTAIEYEESKQDLAIGHYGYILKHTKEVRHLPLLVPAYVRIVHLLAKTHRWSEVEGHIDQFESQFPNAGWATHFPSLKQRAVMRTMKTQALKNRLMQLSA
ncbi:MAG TPA: hypothetical protein VJL88_11745 [Nitrospira sp.]|nr:hypothetical protein [Nitrospira sp.]